MHKRAILMAQFYTRKSGIASVKLRLVTEVKEVRASINVPGRSWLTVARTVSDSGGLDQPTNNRSKPAEGGEPNEMISGLLLRSLCAGHSSRS